MLASMRRTTPPMVLATNLAKTFVDRGRRTEALAGLNLEIGTGEFVSIIGPSGCGKSTLLRLVGGLIEADHGKITVAGSTPLDGRRVKRFGLVPQSPALLPWRTVRENLNLLPRLNRGQGRGRVEPAEIEELLEAVGLSAFAESFPAQLSGGMQQRVSLARAFALRPPILLMDEPFAALDEITRSDMRFQLLALCEDTAATVLFVTHSIEEAVLLSDRVLMLTSRPGTVFDEFTIELERPRRQGIEDLAAFHRHTALLRNALNKAARASSSTGAL